MQGVGPNLSSRVGRGPKSQVGEASSGLTVLRYRRREARPHAHQVPILNGVRPQTVPHVVTPMAIVAAVNCSDKSDEELTKFVVKYQLISLKPGQSYSCRLAKKDGACSLPIAKQLCAQTCSLCRTLACSVLVLKAGMPVQAGMPKPWTFLRTADHFCVSSKQRCDAAARCGDSILHEAACKSAAAELGLATSLTTVHAPIAPRGCFVSFHNQTFFNTAGSISSDFTFAKSLCRLKEEAPGAQCFLVHVSFSLLIHAGFLNRSKVETVDTCGTRRALLTYAPCL